MSIRLIPLLFLLALSAVSHAAGQKSGSYSMDYSSPVASGVVSNAGQYTVVSKVTTKGFVVQPVSSARYSIAPAVGTAGAAATAPVRDWALY